MGTKEYDYNPSRRLGKTIVLTWRWHPQSGQSMEGECIFQTSVIEVKEVNTNAPFSFFLGDNHNIGYPFEVLDPSNKAYHKELATSFLITSQHRGWKRLNFCLTGLHHFYRLSWCYAIMGDVNISLCDQSNISEYSCKSNKKVLNFS